MEYKTRKRNTPIATLIKNYINKNSGKVSDSRGEIQRRFDYLDWKDQKKIMQVFLESGKTDRQWAYSKLVDFWDKSFEPKVQELWEQLHEDKCSWVVIRHFPVEYLSKNIDQFTGDRDYYFICLRLAEDKNYVIDRDKLSLTDYVSVLYHTDRPISDEEAIDCLFKAVYNVCTEAYLSYTRLDRYSDTDKAMIVSPIDFQDVNLVYWYLRKMELLEVLWKFDSWNEKVQKAIYGSHEYKSILNADLYDYELRDAKVRIAKKYAYIALENKYKTAKDFHVNNILENGILAPKEWFIETAPKKNKKKTPEPITSETVDPAVLREMMAKNPALEKLVGDFGLDIGESELP